MTSQIGQTGYSGPTNRGISKERGLPTDALACAVYEQREALLRRVAVLSDDQWDLVCPAPAPPPGVVRLDEPRRTVREIVAHLLVVDDLVLGGSALRSLGGLRRLEHPGAWDRRRVEPLAASPVAELVTLLADRGQRFGRLVAAAPPAVRRLPVAGPHGRQPLAGLLSRRVLHEWLHEQDIAAAVPSELAAAEMSFAVACAATDAVLRLLPDAVLPRTNVAGGVLRLVVDLDNGSHQRRIWGLDFSRRQYGPRVLGPAHATIRTTATALALLANGRGPRIETEQCVDIDGDSAMASAFLDALVTPGAPVPCLGLAVAASAS